MFLRPPLLVLDQPVASCSSRCTSAQTARSSRARRRCWAAAASAPTPPPDSSPRLQPPLPRLQPPLLRPQPAAPAAPGQAPVAPGPPSRLLSGAPALSRPQLQRAGAQQRRRVQRAVTFDDQDTRLAMYDTLQVQVTSSGATPAPVTSFNDMFPARKGQRALQQRMKRAGLSRPTPLQAAVIAAVRESRDVVACGPPGAGMTHAWLLPLLQRLKGLRSSPLRRAHPRLLVVAPSRELVAQLAEEVVRLTEGGHLRVVGVAGGAPLLPQVVACRSTVDVLVGTPGRLVELVGRGVVRLGRATALVLEEVDQLVTPSLEGPLRQLITHPTLPPPGVRQTVLAASSAAPPHLLHLAAQDLLQPSHIAITARWPSAAAAAAAAPAGGGSQQQQQVVQEPSVAVAAAATQQQQQAATGTQSEATAGGAVLPRPQRPVPPPPPAAAGTEAGVRRGPLPRQVLPWDPRDPGYAPAAAAHALGVLPPCVRQRVLGVSPRQKPRMLLQLLAGAAGGAGVGGGGLVLVFVDARETGDALAGLLAQADIPAGLLHPGRTQMERDEALQCFRFGVTPVLIATSLAARGLDLPDITAVVNYDMPGDLGEYARRVGRLGRGGQPGVATTLFGPGDAPLAPALLLALRGSRQPVPEWLEDMAAQQGQGQVAGEETAGQLQSPVRAGRQQGAAGPARQLLRGRRQLAYGSYMQRPQLRKEASRQQ